MFVIGCGGDQSAEQSLLKDLAALGARVEYNDAGQATFINLSDTDVDNDSLGAFARLTAVEKLWLADTNVTDDGLASIGEMKQLTYLVLSNTYVSNDGLKHLESLENLTELYLDGTRVTAKGVEQLNKTIPKLSIVY